MGARMEGEIGAEKREIEGGVRDGGGIESRGIKGSKKRRQM